MGRKQKFQERLAVIDRKLKLQWAPVIPGTVLINGILASDKDVNFETGEVIKPGALPGDFVQYEAEL